MTLGGVVFWERRVLTYLFYFLSKILAISCVRVTGGFSFLFFFFALAFEFCVS